MGLLDDAIRDHIELKKRSGESPDEIEKIESELLSDKQPVSEPETADDSAQEDLTEPVAEQIDAAPAESSEPVSPDVQSAGETKEPSFHSFADDDEVMSEPIISKGSPPQSQPVEPIADNDESVDSGEEIDEEVLEATPDFLEDTPEHDQMWFEQKPPRDFDFND